MDVSCSTSTTNRHFQWFLTLFNRRGTRKIHNFNGATGRNQRQVGLRGEAARNFGRYRQERKANQESVGSSATDLGELLARVESEEWLREERMGIS